MPREVKKRGRRQQQKNRDQHDGERQERPSKRFKTEHVPAQHDQDEVLVTGDAGDDFIGLDTVQQDESQAPEGETEFYGLLDPQEQEYYANVNNQIVANDFESSEDRAIFIDAVHRETEDKEIKVASSQSSSRILEKIISLSTAEQLQRLFGAFLGNLTYLVQHRFGSHCCEALFLQAAKFVDAGSKKRKSENKDVPTLESLFLQAAVALEPDMGFLLTDRFGSHTVRMLLLVLSGESLEDESVKTMLASKKKEKLEGIGAAPDTLGKRNLPDSFRQALNRLISSAISSLDTTYLRALATHPTGNPVLQLLLRLELSASEKQPQEHSVLQKMLPDKDFDDDSESAKFIVGLVYDPTGSHLVEMLVQKLPGKTFKKLYKNVLKQRLASIAKNDTASYVAIRILERLGKDDLIEAKKIIVPELPILTSRRRTGLIKVLIERCVVREVTLQDVADALKSQYTESGENFVAALLDLRSSDTADDSKEDKKATGQTSKTAHKTDVHGSLLAQAMLQASCTCSIVQSSLSELDDKTLRMMCQDSVASRLIQAALSPTPTNMTFRRQLVPRFYDVISDLAQNLAGSYVADALWSATDGLHFMKERLGQNLADHESQLRESPFGRNVWKNWSMDLFYRRPAEWRALAKGQNIDQPQELAQQTRFESAPKEVRKKTAIELARERHAKAGQKKAIKAEKKQRIPATSANAISITS